MHKLLSPHPFQDSHCLDTEKPWSTHEILSLYCFSIPSEPPLCSVQNLWPLFSPNLHALALIIPWTSAALCQPFLSRFKPTRLSSPIQPGSSLPQPFCHAVPSVWAVSSSGYSHQSGSYYPELSIDITSDINKKQLEYLLSGTFYKMVSFSCLLICLLVHYWWAPLREWNFQKGRLVCLSHHLIVP